MLQENAKFNTKIFSSRKSPEDLSKTCELAINLSLLELFLAETKKLSLLTILFN